MVGDVSGPFNRRIEDGDLVIWRTGLTFWLAVWGNDHGVDAASRRAAIQERDNPSREQEQLEELDGLQVLTY